MSNHSINIHVEYHLFDCVSQISYLSGKLDVELLWRDR